MTIDDDDGGGGGGGGAGDLRFGDGGGGVRIKRRCHLVLTCEVLLPYQEAKTCEALLLSGSNDGV